MGIFRILLFVALIVSANAFASSDNLMSTTKSFNQAVVDDWKSQARGDFKKAYDDQIARISRLLVDSSLRIKNVDSFQKKFEQLKNTSFENEETNYNLYTIDVNGENLKRITNAKYDDVAPAWLPDGNIVFCTSRGNGYVRCAGSEFPSTVLARCDTEGKNIYFLSTNNEADFMPYVIEDGRILYCRWEYVDENIFRVQSLWSVNPDGTNPQVFLGGQSHAPDLKIGAVQITNTDKFIFQTSSHHNVFRNGLAILRPNEGILLEDWYRCQECVHRQMLIGFIDRANIKAKKTVLLKIETGTSYLLSVMRAQSVSLLNN